METGTVRSALTAAAPSRRSTNQRYRWLTAALLLVVGCGRGEPESPQRVEPPTANSAETAPGAGDVEHPGGLELPPGDIPAPATAPPSEAKPGIELPADAPLEPSAASGREGQLLQASWDQIQASAQSTGQVTVVDLWALSCPPCLKAFPHLVELHRTMSPAVACISVNMDYDGRRSRPPQHYAPQVQAFVAGAGGFGFPNYLCETPSDEIFAALQIASLPAVLVYRADGELAEMFVDAGQGDGVSYEREIVPLVERLANR